MPPPPVPKQSPISAIPLAVVRTTLVRVLMLVVVLASIWLAWWSVKRLDLIGRTIRERDAERAAVITEVQQLEAKWDAVEAERLELRVKEARELLFTGPQEWDTWQKELRRRGIASGLATTVQLGNAQVHPQTEHGLSIVPVTLELQPAPAVRSTNSPYQRLLNVAGTLQNAKRRIDLLELSVLGQSNSVQNAKAVLQLWSAAGAEIKSSP